MGTDINIDAILDMLNKIQGILVIIVPAVLVYLYKLRDAAKNKSELYKNKVLSQNKEKYDIWLHNESRLMICKIRELCNFYHDTSKCDQVLFLQLENGTVATNKLCNMYVTCLAEDDRHGQIPKKTDKVHKIPYVELSDFVEAVSESTAPIITSDLNLVKETNVDKRTWADSILFEGVKSCVVSAIKDNQGYLLGIACFNYNEIRFDKLSEDDQKTAITKFQISLETTFLSFHVSSRDKKNELGILDIR